MNYIAGIYASKIASNSVTDIILSNIPVYNVYYLFTYGTLLVWVPLIFIIFLHPKRIPFVLKSIALFLIIRSIFVCLTHIGPFPTQINIAGGLNSVMNFTGDLFFSGHTGLPFLLALIFWQEKNLRFFFLICSVFFGIVVLLGHLHYSIDVLGAFFITYAIFHMAEFFFKKDRLLFFSGIEN
ncbi:MAG: phosphatase PAP2-related protein [Candidatus Paceibacterota bacterium]